MLAIEVKNLSKIYNNLVALDNLSFEVKEGEIFGFLGPNGAGKTTCLSILSCLQKQTSGKAKVLGFDIASSSFKIKSQIGIVPQEIALYPTLSAIDNLRFFGKIYGLSRKELKDRSQELLTLVGLWERRQEKVENYSGGMKRRLNLICGLLHQPKILFLDEPTVGVDPQSRNKIFEFVQELNKQGITILYTTHYMEEAQKLCHRVLIIDKGKKIACDTPDNLIKLLGGGIVELRQKEVQLIGLEQLKKIPEIKSIQPRKENFKIEVENLENVLPQIVSLFLKYKIPLHFLKVWEPNLESVFLHLTGKELRE